jgi:hypothetical protein
MKTMIIKGTFAGRHFISQTIVAIVPKRITVAEVFEFGIDARLITNFPENYTVDEFSGRWYDEFNGNVILLVIP